MINQGVCMYSNPMKKSTFCLLLIFLISLSISGFSQNQIIDSLKLRLNEVDGEERIKTLIGLSYNYLRINPDTSLFYSNVALDYSIETENKRGVARALLMLGSSYSTLGDNSSAIENHTMALTVFQEIKDTIAIGITRNNLGIDYHNLGDYEKAIEQYNFSMEIASAHDNNWGICYATNNIGTIYEEWFKLELALEYYNKTLELAKELDDDNYICVSLQNIGVAHRKLGNYDLAIEFLEKSLIINEQIGTTEGIYNSYINRGEIYQNQKKYDMAIIDFKKAMEVSTNESNDQNISESALKLGIVYSQTGNYKRAEEMLNYALSVANELDDPNIQKEVFNALSDFYSKNNDFKKAYKYHVNYTILKDTIFNRDSRHEISEMETLYELDKKEKEIEISSLKIKQQQTRLYYIISGIVLLIILSYLLFNRYKLKQKQVRMELEKKSIEFEQRLLRTQMNPHFIFNSLNSINSFITDNNSDSAQIFLSKFARLMRYILENSRKTMVPIEDEIATLELNLELEQLRFDNRFDFKIGIDKSVDQENTYIPPMLLQPFVENAILHGVAGLETRGLISIKMIPKNKVMLCSVEDNGVGRQKAMENKSMKSKSKHRSLGMQVTQERLDILKEKTGEDIFMRFIDLMDEANNPSGTRVELQIPFEEE